MFLSDATQLFIDAYTGIKHKELSCYRYTLKNLITYTGDCDITAVKLNMLRAWRATLSGQQTLWSTHPTKPTVTRRLSPFTIAGHITRCKRFFAWLVEEELLKINPATRLEKPKINYNPDDITQTDIDKMIAVATSARDHCIIMLLIESGCRVGGLVSLRVGDLDLPNCRAWALEKGNTHRYIYFSQSTANELQKLTEPGLTESERVFTGKRGELTTSGVYQALKRLAKKAGVKRFNPHSFRHACARRMIAHSASIEDVAAVLGHTTSEVTRRYYAPWQDAEIQKRHQRFAWYGDSPTGKNSV